MSDTILVVEDNPLDIELVQIAMEKCGFPHEVEVVRDGEEALDFLLASGAHASRVRENPAVIVLDLKLPRINGIEVLAKIRQTPELASIPVIILSASAIDKDLEAAHALGISSYIVKPMEWQGFSEKLCHAMEAQTSHTRQSA
ncbi:response regulator [Noviherbaspirillum aerium]|uniref:response regulator n=1 Tax=Noviherbaspirillum aerium TaxID=2588497 RepID=UPI00124E8073|nr:response regulator [Noviherbaspirillum aerium]